MKLMADSDVDLGCDKRRDKTRECLCQLVQKLDINFTKLPLPSYLAPSPPTHTLSTEATALVNASFPISFDNILDVRVTSCAFNQSNIHICRLE